jgi:hypothetical protein
MANLLSTASDLIPRPLSRRCAHFSVDRFFGVLGRAVALRSRCEGDGPGTLQVDPALRRANIGIAICDGSAAFGPAPEDRASSVASSSCLPVATNFSASSGNGRFNFNAH